MSNPAEEIDVSAFPPRIIPLSWENEQLLPQTPLGVSSPPLEEITILHTNDLHSSVDGRQSNDGSTRGGLARIATTILRARAAGPTLVFDSGDFVYGGGTWWDVQGGAAVAYLRGKAGCDLATIGNHDLERGIAELRQLLAGGFPFVSANLYVEDPEVNQHLHPACIIEIAGWRIGVIGLTTLSTFDLIPGRLLQGIRLTEPYPELIRVVAALEPLVDTIVVLSHLGFYESGTGDPNLARQVAGSKVAVILGAHTHDALNPARIVDGITICNAGAYGVNVGEVKLKHGHQNTIEVRTRLIPQDGTISDDPLWLEARAQAAQAFQPLYNTTFPLPALPPATASTTDRTREWTLLARALCQSGLASPSALLMVPRLYVLGQLPIGPQVTLAELMTVYPSIEYLVAVEINGQTLKDLIALQPSLLNHQQALPLLLSDETEMLPEQVEESSTYNIVTTELVCEGKMGWERMPDAIQSSRGLDVTCLQVVQSYLNELRGEVTAS